MGNFESQIIESFRNRLDDQNDSRETVISSPENNINKRLDFLRRTNNNAGLFEFLENEKHEYETLNLNAEQKRVLAIKNIGEQDVLILNDAEINQYALEQYLFERIGEWLDQEIAKIDDMARNIREAVNSSEGALANSEADLVILRDDAFNRGMENNIQRLATGATREDLNLSVEQYDLLQRLYVFGTALTQAGFALPSDLIDAYADLEKKDDQGKTNRERREQLRTLLLAEAGKQWGGDTTKINEFIQQIDTQYAEKARDINKLEKERNGLVLTREIRAQGAETFTQYIQVVQSGDEEQFAEFLKNNKEVEEILNRHEIKDAELSRRISVLQEKVEGGSISQSIEDIIEKKGFDEEEQMALLNFMEEDPESTRKFIEMMENNPDSGRELISIMQRLEPEQDMKIERTNDGYSIFVVDGNSQIELKLFDKDSGKKGMEGIKLDAFGTALFPFAVTPENFQEIFQIYRAYSQLKEVIPHALPEIINFKEGLEIIDDASLETLRNIIRSSGDQSEGSVKLTDEFNSKVNSMRIKIDARKTAAALSAAEVLQLEKDMFNENFSWYS